MIAPLLLVAPLSAAAASLPGTDTRSAEPSLLGVVTIPNPEATLPKLRRLIARRHSSARRRICGFARGDRAAIGFDVFDPGSLDAIGVSTSRPAYLWVIEGEEAVAVIDLAIKEPDRLDRALRKAPQEDRASAGVSHAPDVDAEPRRASKQTSDCVAIRRGSRLYVAGRSTAFGVVEKAERPSRAPSSGARAGTGPSSPAGSGAPEPDLWIYGEGDHGVERVEGTASIESRGVVRAHFNLFLDFAADLVVADLTAGSGRSRRLIAGTRSLGSVFEVAAALGPSPVAIALDATGLSPAHTRAFSGEIHAFVTGGGTLVIAAGLRPGIEDSIAREGVAHLSARWPSARVDLGRNAGAPLLLGWVPGKDAKALAEHLSGAVQKRTLGANPSVSGAESSSASRSASEGVASVEITFRPRDALALLDRALGRSHAEREIERLAKAHARFRGLLGDVDDAQLEVRFPPGRIEIDAILQCVH